MGKDGTHDQSLEQRVEEVDRYRNGIAWKPVGIPGAGDDKDRQHTENQKEPAFFTHRCYGKNRDGCRHDIGEPPRFNEWNDGI